MTVEADTARIFRAAAADLRVQNAPVVANEVGFVRYCGPDGSTIGMSVSKIKGRTRLLVQWSQRPQLRQLEIGDPTGDVTFGDVASASALLIRIAASLDETETQPPRPRDRAALELCAAIGSAWACIRGRTGPVTMNSVRIWAATSMTPPVLRIGRPHGAVESLLRQFVSGYRTTRADMNLQPKSAAFPGGPTECFELSGKMDMLRFSEDGGIVEAMRQIATARSLAHPVHRPADRIEAALAEAGA